MPMTKGQAIKFFNLLRGLGIIPSPHGWQPRPTPEETEKLLSALASDARHALGAGPSCDDVREGVAGFFADQGRGGDSR